MTIEQRKVSLINWITNINDELILDKLEGLQSQSLEGLPTEIVKLMLKSDEASDEECTVHKDSKSLIR